MGNPPQPLLSVAEAQERLLRRFEALEAEEISLAEAAGRVLAEAIRSTTDLPPFPNSSMDGFAVRAEDTAQASAGQPVRLRVVGDAPAGGAAGIEVKAGQAVRIMTGAPIPEGADAVVPVEDTSFHERQAGSAAPDSVEIYRPVRAGDYVRPRGQDVSAGEVVIPAGERLTPQGLGLLSMIGQSRIPVHRRPRVAIFSSGDELLPVEEPLTPGKIHDANSYILIAAVEEAGGEAVHLGIVPDRADAVRAVLQSAAAQDVDLILSSAGVSVGAFDFVRSVVEEAGELDFWRVNMRPGKPLAFGSYQGVPFIGLPGNPVSAFVGFEVFVRPALLKMAGARIQKRSAQKVEVEEAIESDGRESYLRATARSENGRYMARLTGHQGSGNLRSLVQANALLIVPAGVKHLDAGAEVDAWLIGNL